MWAPRITYEKARGEGASRVWSDVLENRGLLAGVSWVWDNKGREGQLCLIVFPRSFKYVLKLHDHENYGPFECDGYTGESCFCRQDQHLWVPSETQLNLAQVSIKGSFCCKEVQTSCRFEAGKNKGLSSMKTKPSRLIESCAKSFN
jgi:hypothetical protein